MCKLAQTSETAIAITFLVMNLEKLLKVFLFLFSNQAQSIFFCWICEEITAKYPQKGFGEMQERLLAY
jgi:hypothetical protein